MRKNVAGQRVGAQMVSATDGSAFTGSVTVAVTLDAGTLTTGSVGSGACTHEGSGYHTYAPSQAETNGDLVAFTFTGTGAIPVTVQIYTSFPQTGDNYARIGAPAGASIAADVAAVKSDTGTALTRIGVAGAGLTAIGDTRLANLDATVSSRSTYAGADTAGTTTLLSRLTSGRATGLDNLDATVSSRSTYAGGDTSGTTTLLSRLTATRAGNLDNVDATVSSRLASASYTAPDNATIAAIEADTTDIQGRLPAALIGGRMSSQVGAMGADVWDSGAVATTGANEIRDAIGNASDSGYTTADTLGNTLRLLKSGATGLVPFTVGTSSTTTSVTTNLTEATNDHYNGRTVVFLSGALAGQAASITDYVGSTKVLTVSALTEAPANTDLAVIV